MDIDVMKLVAHLMPYMLVGMVVAYKNAQPPRVIAPRQNARRKARREPFVWPVNPFAENALVQIDGSTLTSYAGGAAFRPGDKGVVVSCAGCNMVKVRFERAWSKTRHTRWVDARMLTLAPLS